VGTGQKCPAGFCVFEILHRQYTLHDDREKIPHSPKGYPNTLGKDALVGAKNGGNSEIKQENPIITTAMHQAK